MSKKYDAYVKQYGKTFNLECMAYSLGEDATNLKYEERAINRELIADPEHPGMLVVTCVQASTFFNKNDHYFIPQELWAAKNTGKFMIVDWEHDRSQIIGCISDTFAIDGEGNLLSDDAEIDDNFSFDVGNELVVWKRYYEDYAKTISEMYDANKLFVSMECAYNDFDFAVQRPGEEGAIIVARNENTDFLTDHLRTFGGTGKYQDHRLGIAFRDFSFIGIGFCERPANDKSIITDVAGSESDNHKFVKIEKIIEENAIYNENSKKGKKIGVRKVDGLNYENFSSKGDNDMDLEKKVSELEAKVETAQAEKVKSEAKAESDKTSYENEVKVLNEKIADLEGKVSEASDEKDNVLKEVSEKDAKISDLEKANEDLSKKVEELEAGLKEIEIARRNEVRKAEVAKHDIEITDDELFAMSDEEYSVLVKYAPKKEESAESEEDKGKKDEEDKAEKAKKELEDKEDEAEEDESEDNDENEGEASASEDDDGMEYIRRFRKVMNG